MSADSSPRQIPDNFVLHRNIPEGVYLLRDVAEGLGDSPAVKAIFPDRREREEVLGSIKVRIRPGQGYMRVDNFDLAIIVAQDHLRFSDIRVVYLDFIHELVHIKQVREGKKIFSREVRYVDKDTEIEAYQVTVLEARRIGMSEDEIRDYLDVPWIDDDEYAVLLRRLGVRQRKDDGRVLRGKELNLSHS
ncbi:MAG: hypothetical protein QXI32_01070 [Candidatus Bathyarchaeia archaeon]